MTGIVIYKSRYGAAKQYAEWIADTLQIPAKNVDDVGEARLAACDYVIAGSSIYMGKILMKDWLAKHSKILKDKKLFLFIVGAAPPDQKEKTEKYFSDNVSREMLAQSECFYLLGKSIFKDLSWSDKIFLKMGAMLAKDPRDKKAMLTDFNAIQRKNLEELLKAAMKFESVHPPMVEAG